MARHVKVFFGKVHDGDSETSASDHLSKKIYDAISGATTIHSVTISKYGTQAMGMVIYDD